MFTEETKKTAKDLRVIDDALFRLVAADLNTCQEMLRTLLDNKDLKVLKVTPQNTITSLHREIILDVLCEVETGLVNIEVQKGTGNDDIRRTRFHLASVTANSTPEGTLFSNVPDVTVIYITEYDALKNGQVFTISEMCAKTGNNYVPLRDGAKICFANTVVKDDSDKSELLQLMLEKNAFDNVKFPNLSNRVNYLKNTEKGREEVCALVENYAKEVADREKYSIIISLLKQGVEISCIANATNLSQEDILEIKEKEGL